MYTDFFEFSDSCAEMEFRQNLPQQNPQVYG